MNQLNLRAITRGGDQWLYKYRRSPMPEINESSPVQIAVQYEDRDVNVLDILRTPHTEESLLSAVQSWVCGEILMLYVGQEENRSSGYPIRFIKVAFMPQEVAA